MKEDGGPVFPIVSGVLWDGMTLRDWFAGQALAAIVAKCPFVESPENYEVYNKTAIGAYDYADAMLVEREKEK